MIKDRNLINLRSSSWQWMVYEKLVLQFSFLIVSKNLISVRCIIHCVCPLSIVFFHNCSESLVKYKGSSNSHFVLNLNIKLNLYWWWIGPRSFVLMYPPTSPSNGWRDMAKNVTQFLSRNVRTDRRMFVLMWWRPDVRLFLTLSVPWEWFLSSSTRQSWLPSCL